MNPRLPTFKTQHPKRTQASTFHWYSSKLAYSQTLYFLFKVRRAWVFIRELKQQRRRRRRRRLRKRHLKSEFALLQTLSRLFHLVYFVKCWQMFFELNSRGLYQSSGKEKQSCCLAFPSSTKREFRHFHVVVVQRRLRNVQKKRDARAKLLFR